MIKPKLHIALVCDMMPGMLGGTYESTLRFAQLLNQRGHRAILICAHDSKKPAISKYKNIPVYQLFSVTIPGSDGLYYFTIPKAKRLEEIFVTEKIDVVHIMFASYLCYQSIRVAKKLGIPVVSHAHTQPENMSFFIPKRLRFAWVENIIFKYLFWFLRAGSKSLVPSQFGKNIFMRYDSKLNMDVISNGVDLTRFHKISTDSFFSKYGLSKKEKHLLCVARFMGEKSIITLIEAFPLILEKNKLVHLNLVGAGPLLQPYKQLCVKLGISDHVTFYGQLSDTDLLGAYNACDIFVLPSLVELEGMVVLEAMACGKPIVIANSPLSASVYFVKDNGVLFEKKNHVDLAKKVLSLLGNDILLKKMGNNSKKLATKYDILQSVAQLEKTYEFVIKSKK